MATASPTKTSSSDSTTQEASNSSHTTGNRFQGSEDFLDNPTRDTLAEGLIGLLTPSIEQLDQGISNARGAQLQLKDQLSQVSLQLCVIAILFRKCTSVSLFALQLETQLTTINSELDEVADLDPYVNKLSEAKKKVIVINSMLQVGK